MADHTIELFFINGYSFAAILLVLLRKFYSAKSAFFNESINYLGGMLMMSALFFSLIEGRFWFSQWYSGVNYFDVATADNEQIYWRWFLTVLIGIITCIPLNSSRKLRIKNWVILTSIFLINAPFIYHKLILLITNTNRDYVSSSIIHWSFILKETILPSLIVLGTSLTLAFLRSAYKKTQN